MSRHPDPTAAEHLLDGGRPSPAPDRLADLLAAAAAPARPDELAGEPAAMVAFRQARLIADAPTQRRQSVLKLALAKMLTVKVGVATAATAATLAGGAALAATGTLPNPASGLGAAPPATPAADHAADRNSGPGEGPAGPAQAAASPSPSLVGLCEAYLAGAGDNPGRALETPAMRALIDAAGGEEEVEDFCADLAPAATGRPEVPAGPAVTPPVEGGGPPSAVPGPPAADS